MSEYKGKPRISTASYVAHSNNLELRSANHGISVSVHRKEDGTFWFGAGWVSNHTVTPFRVTLFAGELVTRVVANALRGLDFKRLPDSLLERRVGGFPTPLEMAAAEWARWEDEARSGAR